MSRGGGGGRGGHGNQARLNHGTMPFEIPPELVEQADGMKKAEGLWPAMDVPKADPLTNMELREVENYIHMRTRFQLGAYYRRLPESRGIVKRGRRQNKLASIDAFDSLNSYRSHQEHARRKLKESRFTVLPWNRDLLPKELWGVCGLAKGSSYWPKVNKTRSALSTKEKLAKFEDDEEESGKRPDAETLDDDPQDSDKDEGEKDDDAASQDRDDNFEDDEDDMANDYNAEHYFDGGEDDGDDIGINDGGGGGDDW